MIDPALLLAQQEAEKRRKAAEQAQLEELRRALVTDWNQTPTPEQFRPAQPDEPTTVFVPPEQEEEFRPAAPARILPNSYAQEKPWIDRGLGPVVQPKPELFSNTQFTPSMLSSAPKTSDMTKYGMIDPGLAAAQDELDKRNKTGWADPGLLEAEKDNQKRNANPFRINPDYLVASATSQIGYTEKDNADDEDDSINGKSYNSGSGNYTKYGAYTKKDALPWCASFVSWCLNQDNKNTTIKSASTGEIRDVYDKKGSYQWNENGKVDKDGNNILPSPPHAGDIVVFDKPREKDGEHSHIGIVVAYDPTTNIVYTVEGNSDSNDSSIPNIEGCVAYHSYSLGDSTGKLVMEGFCKNSGKSYGTVSDAMKQATGTSSIY